MALMRFEQSNLVHEHDATCRDTFWFYIVNCLRSMTI